MHGIHNPGFCAAGVAAASLPQPRLVRAAQEFEAQMMKELLKPMTGEDEEDANSTGVLGEFASEALGRGLSAAGGLGVAHRIVQDLSQSGTSSRSAVINGKTTVQSHSQER
jgi:Rod binding domain-containing protein